MFTGVIQEIGNVVEAKTIGGGVKLTVEAARSAKEIAVNDSVCINGVCQTVVARKESAFAVEAVEETLKKTTLGMLTSTSLVNIELALKLNDRLGGHIVQGHVDGVGTVKRIEQKESSWLVTIEIPNSFLRYVIPVGSIAIDGVSLTVATLKGPEVTVSIIPHTWRNTIFRTYKTGSRVNVELDLVGKYIERLVSTTPEGAGRPALTMEKLRQWGY